MKIEYIKTQFKISGLAILVILSTSQLGARSSLFGGAASGAAKGALLGALFGKSDGAKRGARLGAVMGAIGAAEKKSAEKKAYRNQQLRIEQERLELERQRLAMQQQPTSTVYYEPVLVKSIQRSLLILGYLGGPIDGVYDSDVAAAIRKYQEEKGLQANGIPEESVLKHMQANGG